MKTRLGSAGPKTGASRDLRRALLSAKEFRSLREMVLFPRAETDAVARFTREFTRYLGVRYGVAVNSGTSALEIAVAATGVGPGDEVIVPSYSFYSTASAVLKTRAKPVFADVRLEDGSVDPEEVRRAVTGRTKAIIAVHLAGMPADLDRLVDLCRARGLILIEDVAQGVGSEWRGRKLGSFGALGCFSFQASKQLAAGEGGFIATDDERLFARCAALSDVGLSPDAGPSEHDLLGGNYRLPYLEAAVLSILLERVDEPIGRREENAALLTEALRRIPGITPLIRPAHATRVNYHFYGFRYDRGKFGDLSKGRFLSWLRKQGLPCAEGYSRPLYAHPAFGRNLAAFSGCFASCERAKGVQPGPVHHANALRLCDEVAGFEQDFLLAGSREMRAAVEVIQRLSRRYAGGRAR